MPNVTFLDHTCVSINYKFNHLKTMTSLNPEAIPIEHQLSLGLTQLQLSRKPSIVLAGG